MLMIGVVHSTDFLRYPKQQPNGDNSEFDIIMLET